MLVLFFTRNSTEKDKRTKAEQRKQARQNITKGTPSTRGRSTVGNPALSAYFMKFENRFTLSFTSDTGGKKVLGTPTPALRVLSTPV